jgi:GT2 family glycosyltransferase
VTEISALISKCAILIPTYARSTILNTTLVRLKENGLSRLPLIVYDDGSPNPDALKHVVDQWPNGRVIRGKAKLGQSAGRNALMRDCAQEYALMLDDDQYFLEVGNLAHYVASGIGRIDNTSVITFARINKATGRRDIPEWVPAGRLPVFQGGTALFHLPSVLSVGGFRDFWGFGYEEPELGTRLFFAGKQIWYDPSIIMEHNQFYLPEEKRDFRLYDYFYARNVVLLSTMNVSLWYGLPLGISRSIRRMLVFKRNYAAKLKGLLDGILDTWRYRAERNPVAFSDYRLWEKHLRQYEAYLNSGLG